MRRFISLLFFLYSSPFVVADVSLTGHEELARIAYEQEPLDARDFIHASLIVSGIETKEISFYADKIERYLKELQSTSGQTTRSDYELGEFLLTYMHQKRLKRYVSSQASIQILLKDGKFNCVSSSILYLIAGRSLGLTVEMIKTKDHTFCRIKVGEKWIDVETTSNYGFNPGGKKFVDESGRMTGFSYLPSGKYRDGRRAGDIETLSLIVHSLLEENPFRNDPRYLHLAIDWFLLTQKESSYSQLAFASAKYVELLNRKNRPEDALAFIESVQTRFGMNSELRQCLHNMIHNQILFFINKKQLARAQSLLDENENLLSTASRRSLAEFLLSKAYREAGRTRDMDKAHNMIVGLSEMNHLEKKVSQNYLQHFYAQKAQEIARKSGNSAAYEFLRDSPEEVRKLPTIVKMKQSYLEIEVHNSFLKSFESGDLAEAERILLESLSVCASCEKIKEDIRFLSRIKK